MHLPADLLERPAGEGARLIVLSRLSDAHHQAKRLGAADDPEALHDFRVSIRRTRAALDSWSERLPRKTRSLRKELTRIQRSTGTARDAEVALEWLEAARLDAGADALRAIDWLSAVFEAERSAMIDVAALAEQFESVRAQLVARVRVLKHDLLAEAPEAILAEALAGEVQARFEDLVRQLDVVQGPQDVERIHQARITGKRLRYLVEPIVDHEPAAAAIVRRLKGLQDLLGDLHDAHVLTDRIAALRIDVDEFALRTSIDSVRARSLARAVALHRSLIDEWQASRLEVLRAEIDHFVHALALHRGVEIERKFLLMGMPELPAGAEVVEIEQGYLPGQRLRERVRRLRREGSVQYYRTLKLGAGVERTEIEEETTQAVFEVLWSLTEGCRIQKRRFLVQADGLTWEVDQFLDRALVLAEVELSSPEMHPALPPWLEPMVVEDVTDRIEYTNLSLAR